MRYIKYFFVFLSLGQSILATTVDQAKLESLQKQILKLQAELNALKKSNKADAKKTSKQQSAAKKRSFKKQTNKYHTTPITTSAIWGVVSDYDGSDLVVSYSSMNQDLMLLKHRERISYPLNRPSIQLSGAAEAQAGLDRFANKTNSDINLSRFELDILAIINPWVSTLASINYDDSATSNLDRTKYSSLYIKRAFITVGKLESSKYYATFGQFHMPFGRYSTLMLTSPIVSNIGKTTGRGMLLGYYGLNSNDTGFNGALFLMQNKTSKPNKENKLSQFGANIAWNKTISASQNFQIGSGIIRNIADADQIRQTLNDANAINKLSSTVPGANLYSIYSINDWRIGVEGTKALRDLIADGTNYNKFSAIHAEVDYSLGVKHFPSNVYLSYDQSWQGALLNIPKQSWSLGAYTHFWKNTLQAIEFRHNDAYNSDYSNISKNMALIQFGVYF